MPVISMYRKPTSSKWLKQSHCTYLLLTLKKSIQKQNTIWKIFKESGFSFAQKHWEIKLQFKNETLIHKETPLMHETFREEEERVTETAKVNYRN